MWKEQADQERGPSDRQYVQGGHEKYFFKMHSWHLLINQNTNKDSSIKGYSPQILKIPSMKNWY